MEGSLGGAWAGWKSSTIATSVVKSELGIGIGSSGAGSWRFMSLPRVIWMKGTIILGLEEAEMWTKLVISYGGISSLLYLQFSSKCEFLQVWQAFGPNRKDIPKPQEHHLSWASSMHPNHPPTPLTWAHYLRTLSNLATMKSTSNKTSFWIQKVWEGQATR